MNGRPRVVVVQSNYLPWKGYFDLISEADVFVFYDDVQFTKNDWRNRNPHQDAERRQVDHRAGGPEPRPPRAARSRFEDSRWQAKHFKTIEQNYRKAPHFERYRSFFEDAYLKRTWTTLSELNHPI